jgi:hypothetical protein
MQLNFGMLEIASKLVATQQFDCVHAHDWLVATCGCYT